MDNKDRFFIGRLKNGDEDAYKLLYDKYYSALCYQANRILKDDFLAEEAVQTVLFGIWEKRKKLQINSSLHSYLYKSVINTSLNILKREKRLNDKQMNLAEIEDYFSISTEDGYSIYLAAECDEKIKKAIKELPEKCRHIFELSRLEGKQHKQIAKELGVTQNTVQKQISIALKKISDSLKGYISVLYLHFFPRLRK